jgi:phage baseplate assembly protein gpV
VSNYSTNSCQLRNEAGSAYVELAGSTINIVGSAVNITAPTVNVTGRTTVDGKTTVTGATDIQGRDFLTHTHSGVMTGGGSTGGVN